MLRILSSALLGVALASGPGGAQSNYPSRPVRIVVPSPPAGGTDIIARVIAKDMSVTLGQTVFVDNKAGASSMIATREVKGAAPDGYTLLFSSLGIAYTMHNFSASTLVEWAIFGEEYGQIILSSLAENAMYVASGFVDEP